MLLLQRMGEDFHSVEFVADEEGKVEEKKEEQKEGKKEEAEKKRVEESEREKRREREAQGAPSSNLCFHVKGVVESGFAGEHVNVSEHGTGGARRARA